MKYSLIVVCLLLTISITAQKAETLEEFYNNVEQLKSSYVEYDTSGSLPMIHQFSEQSYYYEVLWISPDSAFFLEESFFKRMEYGTRQVCQCNQEEVFAYFKQQKKYWADSRKGRFSMSLGNMNFFDKKCLQETVYQKSKSEIPKLRKMLDGKMKSSTSFKKDIKILELDISAQMLLSKKGIWLLDLQGQLPEDLELIEFTENHSLEFIKDDQSRLHYPAASVERWKANFIKSGLFTSKILGGAPTKYLNDRNYFYPLNYGENPQAWNMMFRLYPEQKNFGNTLHAKGNLFASVKTKSAETKRQTVPMMESGTFQLSSNGIGVSIVNSEEKNKGQFTIGGNMPWIEIKFFDKNEKLIAAFEKGKPSDTYEVSVEKGEMMIIEMSSQERITVAIPFDVKMSTEHLKEQDIVEEDDPVFANFSLSSRESRGIHWGLRAEYGVGLPKEKRLQKVIVKSIMDDTGKDLMLGQETYIDSVNLESENARKNNIYKQGIGAQLKNGVTFSEDNFSRSKHPNAYEVKFIAYGLPNPKASKIIIQSDLMIREDYKEAYPISWTDTISFSKVPAKKIAKNETKPHLSKKLLQPIHLRFHTLESSPYQHGVTAQILFAVEDGQKIFMVDQEKSILSSLLDDQGRDLIKGHFNEFDKRLLFVKTASTKYGVDENFNTSKLLDNASHHHWGHTNNVPSFSIKTFAPFSKEAQRAYGKANLVYWVFDENKILQTEIEKNYTSQEQLVLELENETFNFKKSSFTEKDKNKKEYNRYTLDVQEDDHGPAIHSIKIKDESDTIINLQQEDTFSAIKTTVLYIPKDIQKTTLVFEIEYSKIYREEQNVAFEISLGWK